MKTIKIPIDNAMKKCSTTFKQSIRKKIVYLGIRLLNKI